MPNYADTVINEPCLRNACCLLRMFETTGFGLVAQVNDRVALEIFDAALQVFDQQIGQVATEPVTDQDSHNDQVFTFWRHAVGGNLPATAADPVG